MKIQKNTTTRLVILLSLLFLISGCRLFTEGKKKLDLYCPGLNIDINGVSYSVNGARDVYVLSYDPSLQKRVKNYFELKENNFMEERDSRFFDIEIDDENIMDKSDNVIGKTIKTNKGNTEVAFNETTRRIIIVEYTQ